MSDKPSPMSPAEAMERVKALERANRRWSMPNQEVIKALGNAIQACAMAAGRMGALEEQVDTLEAEVDRLQAENAVLKAHRPDIPVMRMTLDDVKSVLNLSPDRAIAWVNAHSLGAKLTDTGMRYALPLQDLVQALDASQREEGWNER